MLMSLVYVDKLTWDQLPVKRDVLSASSLLNRNSIRRWDRWPLGCPPDPLSSQSIQLQLACSQWVHISVCIRMGCLEMAKSALILILSCNRNVSNVMIEQNERQESAPPPSLCCYRDKAPGQRECDHSIDSINKCIRDIEQASLAAVGQSLPCRDDISLEVLKCMSSAC